MCNLVDVFLNCDLEHARGGGGEERRGWWTKFFRLKQGMGRRRLRSPSPLATGIPFEALPFTAHAAIKYDTEECLRGELHHKVDYLSRD